MIIGDPSKQKGCDEMICSDSNLCAENFFVKFWEFVQVYLEGSILEQIDCRSSRSKTETTQ